MAISCAKPDCVRRNSSGVTSYVSLLCASGAGRHENDSIHAHANCAKDISPALLADAEGIPYGIEMMVAQDPQERIVMEREANAHYYCGQPACLASILHQFGSPYVLNLLEQAVADPQGALQRISPSLDDKATRQLREAIEAVAGPGHLARLGIDAQQRQEGRLEHIISNKPQPVTLREGGIRVLLVGAGAVGSMLGAKLLLDGHDVVVVEKPEQAGALRLSGFRLQEGKDLKTAQPSAIVTTFNEAFPAGCEYDLMIVATKAYDAMVLLQQLPTSRCPLPNKIMTIQNGVDAEPVAAQLIGSDRVLAASLTIPVSTSARGNVSIEHGKRGLALAPVTPGESIDRWVELFRHAGFTTQAYADYRSMKWSKLFANLVANASCAILNRKPAVIYRYQPTFKLELEMLKEALAVLKAMDIPLVDLPGSPVKRLRFAVKSLPAGLAQSLLKPQVEKGRGDKMPSLYLDLAAGNKQSEVVFLNGAIVRRGRELNIPTPVNFALNDTLFKIATGKLNWDDFRGKPNALLGRIKLAREGKE